jgi:transcriptional regulator with XRE-family HTH domain
MRPQYSARLRRIPTKIPNAIRQYRLKAGLTQSQLARRLMVRAETISAWERGLTCPTVSFLLTLAKTLGTLAESLYPQFYFRESEEVTAQAA